MRVRMLVLVAVIVAVIAGGGYAYYVNHRVDGPLTGESVTRDIAGQRPVAVMFDIYNRPCCYIVKRVTADRR